ncbi:MAG: metallophosphoesterase [Armatimonadetes bacterium]|nr:metallophosphoesterase [Armatimonadota bacterium]
MPRLWRIVVPLLVVMPALLIPARAQEPTPWVEGSTTLVLLPDTQWYTVSKPQSFEAQTRWIVDHRAARNIAYVLHMGDVTEHDRPAEWDIAQRALGALDGLVPYTLTTGNHDYTGGGRETRLNSTFPTAAFQPWPTFGGTFEDARLENNYHLFQMAGRRWLILNLEFAPRDATIAWADRILTQYADRLAIICTHAYLFRDNTRFDHTKGEQRANPHGYGGDGNDGEQLWQKLVSRHAGVMMVVCGHVRTGGVAYLASDGQHGNLVHQILNDYEAIGGNGRGYLRLLEFRPDGRTVQVKAYSPVLDRYLTDAPNQYSLTLREAPATAAGALGPAGATPPVPTAQAERLDDGRWNKVNVRTVADVAKERPVPPVLSQYGGLASGPRLRASGFFHTERVGQSWTLVDPEGWPFVSVGLCSVHAGAFAPSLVQTRFGGLSGWADQTVRYLKECGFNTLGRWSDVATLKQAKERLAWCTTISFMNAYDNQRPLGTGPRQFAEQTIPVFDAEFPAFCDKLATALEATRDDPWLLGHLSDNELPFRPDGLSCYLRLPASDPGHQAADAWLKAHDRRADNVTDADQLAFIATVAERYYTVVGQAIRRHDPNHLYLGSRLNGRNINDGTLRGSHPVDVVSINMYHHWDNDDAQMDRWAELSGRPILNSEWYAMSLVSEKVATNGAGYRVRSQRDRGLFYQNLCLGMLGNRNCVGWHWFKYSGDDDNSSRGFVDRAFEPHREMIDLMQDLNTRVYALRALLRAD